MREHRLTFFYQALHMHYRSTASSPLLETLNARDSLLKSRLTEKILALNDEVLDRLKQQPTFSRLVQEAFDQAFTTLPEPIDINTLFINVGVAPSLGT
ncbi:MAG: hypothetical protein WBB95_28875, partial [Pseudomonas sp.]|uniref:hypothetical protein n=1 Tax=Pseudomonas sp. TaxID=306 RepID=UPI003C7624A3